MSGCFPSICDNEVLRTVKHPKTGTLAVIFTRGCGATKATGYHLSIVPNVKNLEDATGNVLIAEAAKGDSKKPFEISAAWLADDVLEITMPADARVFRQLTVFQRIQIRYRQST